MSAQSMTSFSYCRMDVMKPGHSSSLGGGGEERGGEGRGGGGGGGERERSKDFTGFVIKPYRNCLNTQTILCFHRQPQGSDV